MVVGWPWQRGQAVSSSARGWDRIGRPWCRSYGVCVTIGAIVDVQRRVEGYALIGYLAR